MPFQIIQNDLTKMQVDAIVNTTNSSPFVGYGVDMGIHQAAGPLLLLARKCLRTIPVGGAGITRGYRLPAKYVIHTVCPEWQGGNKGEVELLKKSYESCLSLAAKKRCKSIAFPLMSAGNHGFPKTIALQTAVEAISAFLMDHDMMVYLVVFSRKSVTVSEKLFQAVESYIDEHYIEQKKLEEYGLENERAVGNAEIEPPRQYFRSICNFGPEIDPDDMELMPDDDFPDPDSSLFEEFPTWDDALTDDDSTYMGMLAEDEPSSDWDDFPLEAPQEARSIYEDIIIKESPVWDVPMPRLARSSPMDTLRELLDRTDEGFSATLLKLIDRTGKKDSEIYNRAKIDRRLFSKIRSNPNYQPSKPTMLAFAVALELDLEETKIFLSRAGLALSHANKQDIVVEFFIKNKIYDIDELNNVLHTLDLPTLGNVTE